MSNKLFIFLQREPVFLCTAKSKKDAIPLIREYFQKNEIDALGYDISLIVRDMKDEMIMRFTYLTTISKYKDYEIFETFRPDGKTHIKYDSIKTGDTEYYLGTNSEKILSQLKIIKRKNIIEKVLEDLDN